jgi:hypothetical protein
VEPTELLLIVADVLKGLNVSYLTVGSMDSNITKKADRRNTSATSLEF